MLGHGFSSGARARQGKAGDAGRLRRGAACLAILAVLLWTSAVALAAPAAVQVQKIRVGETDERIRVVLDVSEIPHYTAALASDPWRLEISLAQTENRSQTGALPFKDPFITGLRAESGPAGLKITVDLRLAVTYRIFALNNPNRLVIDIAKVHEQKLEKDVAPGLKYISWLQETPAGPVWAHILELAPKRGLAVQPSLGNGDVKGMATISGIAAREGALAAVNGTFFAPNGVLIGLLKLNGEIVSTVPQTRAALGIFPGGKLKIGQISYSGAVAVPGLSGSRTIPIAGVNRERGPDELIVYNRHYGPSTGTNEHGLEAVVRDGKVVALGQGNTPIPPDGVVVSAHGQAAAALAGLKPGDSLKVQQSLSDGWDDAVCVLGAGPLLVKDGDIFVAAEAEEFGPDVARGRAPRTAAGLTADGRLLLVVVDGRQKISIGMTLPEMARFMRKLGAVQAMNLDGGGSSEMVVAGQVVNSPSDGRERKQGSGLVILPE